MSQPPTYNRNANFVEYAAAHPGAEYNPADHDSEVDDISISLNATIQNLGLIQRDDGQIGNGLVGADQIDPTLLALFDSATTWRGDWVTLTVYAYGDIVEETNTRYVCLLAHTAGTFATDLAAAKWQNLGLTLPIPGTQVENTPAGNIAATTVQAAINELDTEKAALAGSASQVFSLADSTAKAHGVSRQQIQKGSLSHAVCTGTGDAQAATIATGGVTALVDGMELSLRAVGANVLSTPTLNLTLDATATGAVTIVRGDNLAALAAGDIGGAGHEMLVKYRSSGPNWLLLNPAAPRPATGHVNARLAVSVAANAVTAELKTNAGTDPSASDPAYLRFRNADGTISTIIVTSALSVVASSGSTLGTVSAQEWRIYVGVANDGGTPRMFFYNPRDDIAMLVLISGNLYSSIAEGGAGGADSAQWLYSTAAFTSKVCELLGYFDSVQATAGTWATAPARIRTLEPGDPITGDLLQRRYIMEKAASSGTGTTPYDDTPPQRSTEGNEFMAWSMTPRFRCSHMRVTHTGVYAASVAARIAVALHIATQEDAIGAAAAYAEGATRHYSVPLHWEGNLDTTSAVTFSVRAGLSTAGTTYFNRDGSVNPLYGATVPKSTLVMEEICA